MTDNTFKTMQTKFDNRIRTFKSGNVILSHYEELPNSSRVQIDIKDDLKFVMFFSEIGTGYSSGLKLSMRISKGIYVLSEQYMHYREIRLKEPWEFLQGLYLLLERVRVETLANTDSHFTGYYESIYNFVNITIYKIFPDLLLSSCADINMTLPLSKQFN